MIKDFQSSSTMMLILLLHDDTMQTWSVCHNWLHQSPHSFTLRMETAVSSKTLATWCLPSKADQ